MLGFRVLDCKVCLIERGVDGVDLEEVLMPALVDDAVFC